MNSNRIKFNKQGGLMIHPLHDDYDDDDFDEVIHTFEETNISSVEGSFNDMMYDNPIDAAKKHLFLVLDGANIGNLILMTEFMKNNSLTHII